jgi:hypothetical protein
MIDWLVIMCDNPMAEDRLVATAISSLISSSYVVGAAVGGCLLLGVIMVLTDDKRRPVLARLSTYSSVFIVPLLILIVYIVLIWGARILTR